MKSWRTSSRNWPAAVATALIVLLAQPLPTKAAIDDVKNLAPVRVDAPVVMPPVWRATNAGHVVILLGTVSPTPTDLSWQSSALTLLLSRVEVIVMPPDAKLKLGFFARMRAISSAPEKTSLPEGTTLADTLPAIAYRDVIEANVRFNHGDQALIHLRPGFAAFVLKNAAQKTMHLDSYSPVYAFLRQLGQRNGADVLKPSYSVKVEHPEDFVRRLGSDDTADIACLSSLADLLANHPEQVRAHAEAWAVGDTASIDATHSQAYEICRASLQPSRLLAEHGVVDLPAHMRKAWLAAVADAARTHKFTVAALPISQLGGPDGYIAALQLEGFTVTGPNLAK